MRHTSIQIGIAICKIQEISLLLRFIREKSSVSRIKMLSEKDILGTIWQNTKSAPNEICIGWSPGRGGLCVPPHGRILGIRLESCFIVQTIRRKDWALEGNCFKSCWQVLFQLKFYLFFQVNKHLYCLPFAVYTTPRSCCPGPPILVFFILIEGDANKKPTLALN